MKIFQQLTITLKLLIVVAFLGKPTFAGERPNNGWLVSIGYGSLVIKYDLPEYYKMYFPSASEPSEEWQIFCSEAGYYWNLGNQQILVDFFISPSRKCGTSYVSTIEGPTFEIIDTISYTGLMVRLRHCLIYPLWGNLGLGMISENHGSVEPAGIDIIGLSGSDDPYGNWSWGFDVELFRPPGLWLLFGFQKHNVIKKEGHDKPNWNLITFHLTFLFE